MGSRRSDLDKDKLREAVQESVNSVLADSVEMLGMGGVGNSPDVKHRMTLAVHEALVKADPGLKIAVGMLRKMGFDIPKNIPSCAWVRKRAVHIDVSKVESDLLHGVFTTTLSLRVDEPFEWLEGRFTLPSNEGRSNDNGEQERG